MNFFWGEEKMKTREDKIMFKLDFVFITTYFGGVSFLLVHIWFTPSEGPTGFVN